MAELACEGRLFINNEYINSSHESCITIINPKDNSTVTSNVQVASQEDVDAAVDAAETAYKIWKKTAAVDRAKCMNKLADLIEANIDKLAMLESVAMGQPIAMARFAVSTMPGWWRYYAGWADKLAGEVYPDDNGEGMYKMVRYEPLGVCAGLASWNSTGMFVCWKIAPAVAAGNTFIFKASEKSPLGAIALGDLVRQAGFPPGVINFISGAGDTGVALASHMKIAKISFTGSTNVGRMVQIAAINSNMKRCTLELGGKSPSLVFEDADIEIALKHMSSSFLFNSGQVCAATTRLLIQDTIADSFLDQLKIKFQEALKIYGDPADPATVIGPVADSHQYNRVMAFIEAGRNDGANVITGGVQHGHIGNFIEPTILLDPPTHSSVWKEEIFGPVLVVKRFSTEQEAIQMANDTVYGLGAAVFTKNIARALRLSGELVAGYVGINQPVFPTTQTPFGGMKQSGNGREGGKAGIMGYLEAKTISISMNET